MPAMSTPENPNVSGQHTEQAPAASAACASEQNQEKPKEEPARGNATPLRAADYKRRAAARFPPLHVPQLMHPVAHEWIDTVLKRLDRIMSDTTLTAGRLLAIEEITKIIQLVTPLLMEDRTLVDCPVPAKIVGDLHGHFEHLQKLFDLIGRVPYQRLLFLGDYVDRGPQSVEVMVYLFCLKIRYPSRIFLLRGNHETAPINKIYGFWAELVKKFGYPGVGLWWDFNAVFNRLPLACVVGEKILCMHGGLSPELTSLAVIRNIVRPCEPIESGIIVDLIWADPTNKGDGWFQSNRGMSYIFGQTVVHNACRTLGVDLIIRAHQVVQDGYELMVGRKLITVFSTPNYCNIFSNAAAVVCVSEDLQISFQQLSVPMPEGIRGRRAFVVAAEVPPPTPAPPPSPATPEGA